MIYNIFKAFHNIIVEICFPALRTLRTRNIFYNDNAVFLAYDMICQSMPQCAFTEEAIHALTALSSFHILSMNNTSISDSPRIPHEPHSVNLRGTGDVQPLAPLAKGADPAGSEDFPPWRLGWGRVTAREVRLSLRHKAVTSGTGIDVTVLKTYGYPGRAKAGVV